MQMNTKMNSFTHQEEVQAEAAGSKGGFLRAVLRRRTVYDTEKHVPGRRGGAQILASQSELAFLAAVTNANEVKNEGPTPQQQTYLDHVRQQMLAAPLNEFHSVLTVHRGQHSVTPVSVDQVFTLLTRLAHCARTESHFSIDKAIALASNSVCNVLVPEVLHDGILRNKTRVLVFICMAWISMLYSPRPLRSDAHDLLEISGDQCVCIVNSQPASNAERPICEMIQHFGPLLPLAREAVVPNVQDVAFSAESLYVSLLNARTLLQVGGITIEWVDNVSSHLEFDAESVRLMIFRLPSFSDVNRYENTPFSKLLSEYYDEFTKPTNFTSASFLREVRRSYRLIFADDSGARSLYSRVEKRRAARNGITDPYLTELCLGQSDAATNNRNSYSKASDFPILGPRLSVLQEYIQRQNPKSLTMIWRDRRNPSQWYTFWAVVIIGGLGLLLSITQTGLAAAQVYYAARTPLH